MMLCKEGAFGRHHRLSEQQRRVFASDLAKAALVWRHCPFGAHALLPRERAYVYVTMLRRPLERMVSFVVPCFFLFSRTKREIPRGIYVGKRPLLGPRGVQGREGRKGRKKDSRFLKV